MHRNPVAAWNGRVFPVRPSHGSRLQRAHGSTRHDCAGSTPRLPRPGGRRRAAACALVTRSALAACWACAAGDGCGLVANAFRCPSFSIVTLKTDAGTAAARSRPVNVGCVLHARTRGMQPPQHGFVRRLKDVTDGSTRACSGCIHPSAALRLSTACGMLLAVYVSVLCCALQALLPASAREAMRGAPECARRCGGKPRKAALGLQHRVEHFRNL